MKLHHLLLLALVCLHFLLNLNRDSALAQGGAHIAVGVGAIDFTKAETAAEGRLEYRSNARIFVFNPMLGIMGTADRAVYIYGGINLNLRVGERWVVMPNFAAGAYRDGDGKKLGGTIEFRSGIEFARIFGSGSRLGFAFHHISNASIYDSNPGTESLVLVYAFQM